MRLVQCITREWRQRVGESGDHTRWNGVVRADRELCSLQVSRFARQASFGPSVRVGCIVLVFEC